MRTISSQTFDEERALYSQTGLLVRDCSFDGPADGESAFKEGKNIQVEGCFFNLRYPFWHDDGLTIRDSRMTELPSGTPRMWRLPGAGSTASRPCGSAPMSA